MRDRDWTIRSVHVASLARKVLQHRRVRADGATGRVVGLLGQDRIRRRRRARPLKHVQESAVSLIDTSYTPVFVF